MTFYQKYGWLMLIVVIGILIGSMRIPAPNTTTTLESRSWLNITVPQISAQPTQIPQLVGDAVVWRPLGAPQLRFDSFSSKSTQTYTWLRGTPLEFSTHLLQNATGFFLVWRTISEQLWVALLGDSGEQMSAPIELGAEVEQFTAATTNNNLSIVWIANDTLYRRSVDLIGRPTPTQILSDNVQKLDFAVISDTEQYIVWQSGSALWAATLGDDTIDDLIQLPDFLLAPNEWLSTLQLGYTETQRWILWGVSNTSQPEQELYTLASLPRQGLANPVATEFTLPNVEGLRWAQMSGSQLSIAGRVQNGDWQAFLITLGDDGSQTIEGIDGTSVTAGPVAFSDKYVAWVTLDLLANPELVIRSKNSPYATIPTPPTPDYRQAFLDQLMQLPMIILWLLPPALLGYAFEDRVWVLPMALISYWIAKISLPIGVFDEFPALLDWLNIQSPFWGGVFLLFLSSRIASMIGYIGWGYTPQSVRHAAYFLTDACLTFAIVGASVE